MPSSTTAILVCDWWLEHTSQPQLTNTRSLLPVIDKPLLQLAIEKLVQQGCKEFHILLGEYPTPLRHFLDTGERWGVHIDYHYANPELDLARNLKPLQLDSEKFYWLACPELLPQECSDISDLMLRPQAGMPICWREEDQLHWTGWGCFTGAWLASLDDLYNFKALDEFVVKDNRLNHITTQPPWSVISDAAYLLSSTRMLAHRMASSDQSVSMGRGAIVHPSVEFTGAVYIGRQACIKAGVKLGPNVVICDGAFIDQGAELINSVILPDTYVGTQLELNQAIAAPGKLSSIANGVVLSQLESSFLSSVNGHSETPQAVQTSPALTWLVKLFLWPLYLLIVMIRRIVRIQAPIENSITLPSSAQTPAEITLKIANTLPGLYAQDHGAWISHFSHTFYPGLNEVAAGRLAFFGPELRTAADVSKLPYHWKSLYGENQCGLLSESLLQSVDAELQSGRYAYDAYAIADKSKKYRFSIFKRYLGFVIQDCIRVTTQSR